MLAHSEISKNYGARKFALSAEQMGLCDYWRDCFATYGGIPPRKAIDPTRFATALPRVALLEALSEAAGIRLRFRVAGEVVIRALGCNPKGQWLDGILSPDCLPIALAHFEAARSESGPSIDLLPLPDPMNTAARLHYTGLTVPFEADPETGLPQLFLHCIDPGAADVWAWPHPGTE